MLSSYCCSNPLSLFMNSSFCCPAFSSADMVRCLVRSITRSSVLFISAISTFFHIIQGSFDFSSSALPVSASSVSFSGIGAPTFSASSAASIVLASALAALRAAFSASTSASNASFLAWSSLAASFFDCALARPFSLSSNSRDAVLPQLEGHEHQRGIL